MAELKNIMVNIEIHGILDADKIAEEVKYHLRREIERVGVKPEPLKVGDYARVCGEEYNGYSENGDIVIIKEIDNSSVPFCTDHLNGKYAGWHYATDLVRVTDEEVAEAKRQQAEIEKWAKIGRKPNEFKKSDIVRVTGTTGGHPIGTIGELVDAPTYYTGTKLAVQALGNTRSHIGQIELITPVEARFDV